MTRERSISVVIADDHAVVRRGLAAFIDTAMDIELCATASNGEEAVQAAAIHAPDILLLDLLMPGIAAEETIRSVKVQSPRTQVVVLTSHEGEERLASVTAAGAISYVLKDTPPHELLEVVRRAADGEGTITPRLAAYLLQGSSNDRLTEHNGLTPREIEVLKAIASGASNRKIAEDLQIAERTVKSHVSNILSKLYLSDRTQAAVFAWREGVVER